MIDCLRRRSFPMDATEKNDADDDGVRCCSTAMSGIDEHRLEWLDGVIVMW